MVRASFARRSGFFRPSGAAVVLGIVLVTPALASLSAPWAATELDGAHAIASGHGRYVAVGSTGLPGEAAAWTSTDGLGWEEATVTDPPPDSAMLDVIATEDGFVATGLASMVSERQGAHLVAWHSPDGLEWQEAVVKGQAKSGSQTAIYGLADGPGGTLALGFRGDSIGTQRLWRTDDGLTWEPTELPEANGHTWNTVVSVPQGYLLLGQSLSGESYNWHSADGLTWRWLRDTPQFYDVAVSGTGVLTGIGYQDIYQSPRSPRGWEKVLTKPKAWQMEGGNAFDWIDWDGSEFVVLGRDVSICRPSSDECERNPLLVSVDGTTWSEAAGPDGLPGADEGVRIQAVASLDDSTLVLGVDHGMTKVWTISRGVTE